MSSVIRLRRFEGELFHDVILISQSRENRPRLSPLADAMVQSTRSQEQKLPIERPLLLRVFH